jgi:hypothetical protein
MRIYIADYMKPFKLKTNHSDMKKIFLVSVILATIAFCFHRCDKFFPDEKLSLAKTPYTGNELRTDGYYYDNNDNLISIYFLYRDGIILYAFSHKAIGLDEIEKEMIENNMYNDYDADKSRWGLFVMNGKTIQMERWTPSTGFSLPVTRGKGYIENDTTYHIMEKYYSDTKKYYKGDWVYHFKQFHLKPDSTNKFIR